jgi:hypothetical protein
MKEDRRIFVVLREEKIFETEILRARNPVYLKKK